jgi:hypothetical protein
MFRFFTFRTQKFPTEEQLFIESEEKRVGERQPGRRENVADEVAGKPLEFNKANNFDGFGSRWR